MVSITVAAVAQLPYRRRRRRHSSSPHQHVEVVAAKTVGLSVEQVKQPFRTNALSRRL